MLNIYNWLYSWVKMTVISLAVMVLLFPVMKFNNAYADPPPWAQANGYRDQQYDQGDERDDGEYQDREREREDEDRSDDEERHSRRQANQATYVAPYGIDRGTCDREQVGRILGGIAGATLGSTVGNGDGRTAAIIGGAIIGAIVGGNIGQSMDRADQACVGQILEHDADGRRVAWVDNDSGTKYYVTPGKPFRNNSGLYCRKYLTNAVANGNHYRHHNTACRESDGTWRRID